MSVPEAVRRRFTTMFVGHEPFAYENTDAPLKPLVAHPSSSYSPAAEHMETSIHGCAARTESLCRRAVSGATDSLPTIIEQAHTTPSLWSPHTVFKPDDAEVPALYSSPVLRHDVDDGGNYHSERGPGNDHVFPILPDLISDHDDDDFDAVRAVDNGEEAVTPIERSHRTSSTVSRCPQCQSVIKYLFVDELQEGRHHLHRCQARCTCGNARTKPLEHDGPVMVSRGAW